MSMLARKAGLGAGCGLGRRRATEMSLRSGREGQGTALVFPATSTPHQKKMAQTFDSLLASTMDLTFVSPRNPC